MKPTLKVRYTEWPPWAFDVPFGNETLLDGVLKDVFGALSQSLKFDFIVQSQIDHQFGSLQKDGSYSGMLGALYKNEVDLAGPLVASEQRAAVADFTSCLEFSTLGIITGIESADRNIFLYAKVFSWQVWIFLFVTIIFVSFFSSLLYNVSLDGWRSNQFDLFLQNVWLFWGYLIGKDTSSGSNRAVVKIWPKLSFRVLLGSWLLGPVIILLFSFQGSITSTFAVTKFRPVVADLEELALKRKVVPVTTKGSAVQICFKASQEHAALWKRMENNDIVFNPKNLEEVLLKAEKGTHVLIVDYVYALGIASSWTRRTGRCKIQVEQIFMCQSFIALALRKGLPPNTLRKINSRLNYIIQAKLTDRWMNRVFTNYTHCSKQPSDGIKPLNLTDILGGFLIWGIGILFSSLAFVSEITSSEVKKRRMRKTPPGDSENAPFGNSLLIAS